MSHKDLLHMLDLDGELRPVNPHHVTTGEDELAMSELSTADGERVHPPSPTALRLDEWDMDRGNRLAKKLGGDPSEWADFHASAFTTEPTLAKNPVDKRRAEFLQTLLESPDFQALRTSTMLNHLSSELAAVEVSKRWESLKVKDSQQQQRKQSPAKAAANAESNLLQAVGQAIKAATDSVEELEEAGKALGLTAGLGDGSGSEFDQKRTAEIYQRVRNSAWLRRICELAGRYRRFAQGKQRQKTMHGYDEMIGVTQDDAIGRLLPVELASLGDPTLELNTMRRLIERQTLCREFQGSERTAKGPIIVCVDESASMSGDPICNAKAFALAMAWIAKKQRRWCCLVGFSGGRTSSTCILRPNNWNADDLMHWLVHFFSGGTTMEVVCEELPFNLWPTLNPPKGKTDMVVITDGEVDVPSAMAERFLSWKSVNKVRLISLVLASRAGELPTISDEVHLISHLGTDVSAVERCLSI